MTSKFVYPLLMALAINASAATDIMLKGHEIGRWTADVEAAQKYAIEKKKHILLKFTGKDWCPPCMKMEKTVFSSDAWNDYAEGNIAAVFLDVPRGPSKTTPEDVAKRNSELAKKYKVKGFPTFVLLSPNGKEVARFNTEYNPEKFVANLEKITGRSAAESVIKIPTEGDRAARINALYKSYAQLSKEELPQQTAAYLRKMNFIWQNDPILMTAMPQDVFRKLIAHSNFDSLSNLAKALNNTAKTGTPLDRLYSVLQENNTAIELRLKQINFLRNIGRTDKINDLIPSLKDLIKVTEFHQVKDWANLLQAQHRTQDAVELMLKSLPTITNSKEREILLSQLLDTAPGMSEDQFHTLLIIIEKNTALKDLLIRRLRSNAANVLKNNDFNRRLLLLSFNKRFINSIAPLDRNIELVIMLTRQWQFEAANTTAKYRSHSKSMLTLSQLLENLPSEKALALLKDSQKELFQLQVLRLKLRQGEYQKELFDQLLTYKENYPETIRAAANDFLIDWSSQNSPSKPAQKYKQNPYLARNISPNQGSIAVTRSRQVANLKNLSSMLAELRRNGISVEQSVLTKAINASVSQAELPNRKDILTVFPNGDGLSEEILLTVFNTANDKIKNIFLDKNVRNNVQQMYLTNRREADINRQVAQSYSDFIQLMQELDDRQPVSQKMRLILAKLLYDNAEFQYGKKYYDFKSYITMRDKAFDLFNTCWQKYLADLQEEKVKPSAEILSLWFNCILGASDLNTLEKAKTTKSVKMLELKEALDKLPPALAEEHRVLLGKAFNKIWNDGVKPHLKPAFLNACNDILTGHSSIGTLKSYTKLYEEILSEVELQAVIEGSTAIGRSDFGVFLQLSHTPELESTAGSFAKYIATKHINYLISRSAINYREKLEKNIRKALNAKFHINSITWLPETVTSSQTDDPTKKITPLAFVSLKARDAAVDRLPSIQIDLTFLDGKGSVVLPAFSNSLIINASKSDTRPLKDASIEMIVDDRKLSKGKLNLEIIVRGTGILPETKSILKLPAEYTFKEEPKTTSLIKNVEQREGQLLAYAENVTTVNLQWQAAGKKTFTFPQITDERFQLTYKQYKDADIVAAQRAITLAEAPESESKNTVKSYFAAGIVLLILGLIWVIRTTTGKQESFKAIAGMPSTPQEPTPLSTLNYLRQIQGCIDSRRQEDLKRAITEIEQHYFSGISDKEMDLKSIINEWSRQCRG